jgi:RNA polymerase sigma-70 factor (ECF subfamily)
MMYKELSDKELVSILARESDEDAFCELYTRYRKKLFLFCDSFVKVSGIAEDIVQDVFLTIWSGREMLNPDLSFSSYIYTITRNRILNFLRDANQDSKIKSRLQRSAVLSSEAIDIAITDKEYVQILENAIRQLSPLRQDIFRLSREEKLTHKEIAQQLHISVYTVQENISAALKQIKTHLERHAGFNFTNFL